MTFECHQSFRFASRWGSNNRRRCIFRNRINMQGFLVYTPQGIEQNITCLAPYASYPLAIALPIKPCFLWMPGGSHACCSTNLRHPHQAMAVEQHAPFLCCIVL